MSRTLLSVVVVAVVAVVAIHAGAGVGSADDVTLEITIVDRNGQSLSNTDISVTWNDGEGGPINRTTTADGRALVDVPEGADVSIAVNDDEYVRNRPFRLFDASGGTVRVQASEIGRATFVVEGADGPVESAAIEIRQPGSTVTTLTTNESGVARTPPLEIRRYTVRVTAPGHLQREVTVELGQVERSETITVQRADVDATITVVDDHFEPAEPIEDANVRIESLGTTLTTGSDGTATLSVPVNQNHRVRISKDGYDAERITVKVGEDPVSREVAIQREPSLSLESVNRRIVVGESTVVTVSDEYGERVEGATITVDGETVGETDAQGQRRVPIDDRGEVSVEASNGGVTTSITIEGVDPDATETPANETETPANATDTPANGDTPTETPGEGGPGFGIVVALLAVLGAVALSRFR